MSFLKIEIIRAESFNKTVYLYHKHSVHVCCQTEVVCKMAV